MWAAQGQVAFDWRYWFDQSPTYEQGSSEGSLHMDVDVSGLSKSLHQIHVQVRDTAGMFSEPVSRYFVVPDDGHDSSKLHYWFDQNNAALHVADLVDGMFDLDVSELPSGFHTLHFIVTDKAGVNSEPVHKGFMRATDNASLKWRYWFDDTCDMSVVMPPAITSLIIDVDSLSDGLHYIHFQAMNDYFSEARTQMFIKVPKTMDLDEMFCLVMIDNSLYSKETINMKNGGMATLDLDVKELPQGFHKLDVMVMTPSGALSAAYNSYFVRGYLNDDRGVLRCLYAFDDETDVHETTYSEGISHLNLDVAHLEDGPHSVHWMLADKEGAYVSDKRSWFLKVPLGGNGIAKYSYWLNDADDAKHETVLAEPKSPHDIIALLPVETMPLRSSCFHFEVKDDVPTIYAKNDIHFTFTDRFTRETSISKQYVDYNVKQEVTDITPLQTKQTFERPVENNIKWFSFEAERGDSIAFKASQATSLQVYAPSGKLIYATSGDKSVVYGGAHSWEDGTFYVAIHDVTGTKQNITLDYQHIDRYAILDWDVHHVGNGGCSTITFNGNGFDDLYEIELVDTNGTILKSANLSHDSNVTISARFNFTDVALGDYKAIFHFTTEDKIISSVVNVEEAKDISIKVETIYANRFLLGTANTYTIRITNNGNSTAYQVPLKIQIQADGGTKNIRSIVLSDNLVTPNVNWIESESYSQEEQLVLSLIKEMGNRVDFLTVKDTLDNEEFMEGYFAINLPPLSTTEFTVSLKSVTPVTLYTLVPDEWDFYAYYNLSEGAVHKVMKKSAKGAMCCAREHVECVMNLITGALDFASVAGGGTLGLVSCLASLSSSGIQFAYDRWCGENSEDKNEAQKSLIRNLTAAALGCVSKYDPTKMTWMIQHVYDVISTITSCFSHPKKIPNCPPKPPKPNPSTPVVSLDPNDIYGYTSESGSTFINDEVRDLNYRIEFENDPEFATASAHVVMVENKLDGTYFDLASFAPTVIKIGDKTEYLDGTPNFVRTIDMRPAINAIAEVRGTYDAVTGEAKWTFTSLDPMTMEPTDDVMQGFLPVNHDGISGIGEVFYDISLKGRFPDGTQIKNQATITFDFEDPIETLVWTNIIDAVAPAGHVVSATQKDYETATLIVEGADERSGVWAYDVYVQYGTKAEWYKVAEKVSPREDGTLDVMVYEGINHGFYVCAIDSAGNVEVKEPLREAVLDLTDVLSGDANGDGSVSVGDMTTVISALKGESPEAYDENGADADHDGTITIEDVQAIIRRILRK